MVVVLVVVLVVVVVVVSDNVPAYYYYIDEARLSSPCSILLYLSLAWYPPLYATVKQDERRRAVRRLASRYIGVVEAPPRLVVHALARRHVVAAVEAGPVVVRH